MILLDFRNWEVESSLQMLQNTQKALLKKDFDTLLAVIAVGVVDLGKVEAYTFSNLFFENGNSIAVSSVKNVASFYKSIDTIIDAKQKEIIDYTEASEEAVYFYGTNSLVANLHCEIGICGVNSLSDESLFEEYCEDFELTPFSFDLPEGLYTSDIAVFVNNTLFICLDFITDKKNKKALLNLVKAKGIRVIAVQKTQVEKGVLNMKFVNNTLVITTTAYALLTDTQKKELIDFSVKQVSLPFLDRIGIRLRDIIL